MRREGAPQGVLCDAKPRKWPPTRHRFRKIRPAGRSTGDQSIGVSLVFSTGRQGTPCLQRCSDRVSQARKTDVRMPVPFRKPPDLIATCRVDVRRMSPLERKTTCGLSPRFVIGVQSLPLKAFILSRVNKE